MSRQEFEMTTEDLKALLDASKPTPAMYLPGGMPMVATPQENANSAWARLGEKMGFETMTVQPVQGKGQTFFTAEPTEESEVDPENIYGSDSMRQSIEEDRK